MFGLRMPELLLIGAIVFLMFGGKKLPALGTALGQGIRGFKKAVHGEAPEAAADPAKLAAHAAPVMAKPDRRSTVQS